MSEIAAQVTCLLNLAVAYQRNMATAARTAAVAMTGLAESIGASERREIATHPDLAYLDLQLDGFYADHPGYREGWRS